jgi:hypothetical protein
VDILVTTREMDSVTIQEMDANLQEGGVWILPYDCNPRTKLPAKLQGRHAHWGIVVGMLHQRSMVEDVDGDDSVRLASCDSNNSSLLQLEPMSCQVDLVGSGLDQCNNCYLCVQHSLSSQWAISPLKDWLESNQQIMVMDDYKFTLTASSRLNLQNKIIQVSPRDR